MKQTILHDWDPYVIEYLSCLDEGYVITEVFEIRFVELFVILDGEPAWPPHEIVETNVVSVTV